MTRTARIRFSNVTSSNTVRATKLRNSSDAESVGPRFSLFIVQRGSATFAQRDLSHTLCANDAVLIDEAPSYSVVRSHDFRGAYLQLPSACLKGHNDVLEQFSTRVVDGRTPWGAALAAIIDEISFAHTTSGRKSTALADADAKRIIGVLQTALSADVVASGAVSPSMFERAYQAMCAHAYDAGFNAGKLAAFLSISARYLYKVFAQRRTTYSHELLTARLELAARLLRERRFAEVSIADIAARSGFTDPSHFSRRFQDRYGRAPPAFRDSPDSRSASQHVHVRDRVATSRIRRRVTNAAI